MQLTLVWSTGMATGIHTSVSCLPTTRYELIASLQGQTAIVTGASSGIGRAVALALGSAGANVVVDYVTAPPAAQEVVEEIRTSKANAIAHQADVSDESQVMALFDRAREEFGTVDILVAKAGVQAMPLLGR